MRGEGVTRKMCSERTAEAARSCPARRSSPTTRPCAAVVILLVVSASGCGSPPKLARTGGTPDNRWAGSWWVARDGGGRLVIGLERRTRDDDAEIWLVAECGARRFRFTGTELISWGPPLAENDDNFAIEAPPVLRAWCHAVKGGWDGGALHAFLEAALAGGRAPEDLVVFLRECARDLERPAPVSLHEARRALHEFPTGLKELLALNKSLG